MTNSEHYLGFGQRMANNQKRKLRSAASAVSIHGLRNSPEYQVWRGMKRRCLDPTNAGYKHYGAKGVRICARWLESVVWFLVDMGPRPSSLHSLDRWPDSQGNYEPGNCRWATDEEQNRNRGAYNLVLELHGESMTAVEWHEKTGMSLDSIYKRKQMGWSDERTLTEPVHLGARPGRSKYRKHLEVK